LAPSHQEKIRARGKKKSEKHKKAKMKIKDEIRELVFSKADKVGFVDLSDALPDLITYGYLGDPTMPNAISIGKLLISSLVDKSCFDMLPITAKNYRLYNYDIINDALNKISFTVASILQKNGYQAFPVPATPSSSGKKVHFGYFSHKAVARLAGLGWIGPSCLLITPDFGPRLRWATVFTDAPIGDKPMLLEDGCGKCALCIQACPAEAFTGKRFKQEEDREERMDSIKCHEYLTKMEQEKGVRVCGLCVAICPKGKKHENKDNEENGRPAR